MLALWILLLIGAGRSLGSSCVANLSLSCLQERLYRTLDTINHTPEIQVTEWVSLVRQNGSERESRQEKGEEEGFGSPPGIMATIGRALDTFLGSRSLRISLPSWARAAGTALDINIAEAVVEGRKKGGKKGHDLWMMMSAMMAKMAMLSMAVIKLKALKALLIGTVALVFSKLQLFKLLTSKKDHPSESHVIVLSTGGGGHGGSVGGGGSPGHVVHEAVYGPPSGSGGGWNAGGGDSWGGGGGAHGGGWSSAGGTGGSHGGGWSSGGGGQGGWSSGGPGGWGGGWAKRAYPSPNTYTTASVTTE